jgi:hydroxymethylpyrimidine/phosphomethylpyrimidine kinase
MSRRPGAERSTSRIPAPEPRPVGLTIAGSDSGGGAGIQADIRAMAAHGAFPTSVITSVTAQHTRGVERSFTLPLEEIRAQFDAVVGDFEVGAVKTGMLAEAPVVEAVAERVADLEAPLVVDPVMVATSGDRLLTPAGERAYEGLIAEATLVTPNRDEAAVLTDVEPADSETAREAGQHLLEMGADAALVKGGHGDGNTLIDVLVTEQDSQAFDHPRVATQATHGSGCVLSASIAARLATGGALRPAVERSVRFMQRAIRYPLDVGQDAGAVNPMAGLRDRAQRETVATEVAALVDELIDRDAGPLIPEVGTNVVGAGPYAESAAETLAVEGRIRRTLDGVAVARGVRPGVSSHMARFLLSAREFVPRFRFAANVRNDEATREGLAVLDGPVATIDRTREPAGVSTMNWSAREIYSDFAEGAESGDKPPVAVMDGGALGKEPMIRLVASDADRLADRLETVLREARA